MGAVACACAHNRSATEDFSEAEVEVGARPTLPHLTRAQLLRDFVVAEGRSEGSEQTVVRRSQLPIPEHTGIFALHQQASATLGNHNLRENVRLPPFTQRELWIGAKTLTIYDEVYHLVSVLQHTCTPQSCPTMCCGKHVTYEWADENSTVTKGMPAIKYMSTLVDWAHDLLANPSVVPQDGGEVPDHFLPSMRLLHKRFFRVFAHVYLHHFSEVQENGGEAHLNYCFKHWLFFVRAMDLVSEEQLTPLKTVIAKFEAKQDEAEATNRR
eukprot:CAMPEP_0115245194 /NCGR_PEP_ID=MMETSP0270-20121206/40385_1 /TAXON_ID=71861 /ORGANISM="Scrippsiella trochoidea, Strain CCMP3099" /LENGTH=268 /DNA_ID=CAMNT_0002660369 /DNA_START=114 /DNA_END=916 /DNA_ORIENTATION=-